MDKKTRPPRFDRSEYKIKAVKTDYIVVGPLTSDLQVATGQNLCTITCTELSSVGSLGGSYCGCLVV